MKKGVLIIIVAILFSGCQPSNKETVTETRPETQVIPETDEETVVDVTVPENFTNELAE